MDIRLFKSVVGLCVAILMLTFASGAHATVILATEAAGINNGLGGLGNHYHTNPGAVAGVNYSFGEEGRGVAEFDISGLGDFSSAVLTFSVFDFLDDTFGPDGPFEDPINVLGYLGNNGISLSDFDSPTIGSAGIFASLGLAIGDELSFDITALLQAATLGGTGSLGIMLDPTVQTSEFVATRFSDFAITINTIPEPSSIVLFAIGLLGLTVSIRFRQS